MMIIKFNWWHPDMTIITLPILSKCQIVNLEITVYTMHSPWVNENLAAVVDRKCYILTFLCATFHHPSIKNHSKNYSGKGNAGESGNKPFQMPSCHCQSWKLHHTSHTAIARHKFLYKLAKKADEWRMTFLLLDSFWKREREREKKNRSASRVSAIREAVHQQSNFPG